MASIRQVVDFWLWVIGNRLWDVHQLQPITHDLLPFVTLDNMLCAYVIFVVQNNTFFLLRKKGSRILNGQVTTHC
jgi:hypothetical protein